MPIDNDVLRQAQAINRILQVIHREMSRPVISDINRAPVTVPQMRALAILTLPENLDGIPLNNLTRAMGLSQSTVSGIVERLEKMKFVRRKVDARDRRRSLVEAADEVKTYVQKEVIEQRLGTLTNALGKISSPERAAILQALETLQRLLVTPDGD